VSKKRAAEGSEGGANGSRGEQFRAAERRDLIAAEPDKIHHYQERGKLKRIQMAWELIRLQVPRKEKARPARKKRNLSFFLSKGGTRKSNGCEEWSTKNSCADLGIGNFADHCRG